MRIILFFIICFSFLLSKEENVMLYDGEFKNHIYKGNIENGKLDGYGEIQCEKLNRAFIKGYFKNNKFLNGTKISCDDKSLYNEIKYGIISKYKYDRNYEPFYNVELSGNFTTKDINNNDFKITFNNTQSYDLLVGKGYEKNDNYYVNGTLTLLNNKVKEIKGKFKIKNLNFDSGKIEIIGYDFIMEGYVKDGDDINNFTFDGIIKWNDNYEYYVTNMKFKQDLFEKLPNFKKLATMSKIQNKKELKIETNLINQNKIESKKENLNINIENIKYKNNNIYNNDTILDLEKK